MTGSAPRGTVSLKADRLDPRGRSGGGKGSGFSPERRLADFFEGQNGAKKLQDAPRLAKMR